MFGLVFLFIALTVEAKPFPSVDNANAVSETDNADNGPGRFFPTNASDDGGSRRRRDLLGRDYSDLLSKLARGLPAAKDSEGLPSKLARSAEAGNYVSAAKGKVEDYMATEPLQNYWQFKNMIDELSGRSSSDYAGCGNWCGRGGGGGCVNNIDDCCYIHDACYDYWEERRVDSGITGSYSVYAYHYNRATGAISCFGSYWAQAICLCDVQAVQCFISFDYSYNSSYDRASLWAGNGHFKTNRQCLCDTRFGPLDPSTLAPIAGWRCGTRGGSGEIAKATGQWRNHQRPQLPQWLQPQLPHLK